MRWVTAEVEMDFLWGMRQCWKIGIPLLRGQILGRRAEAGRFALLGGLSGPVLKVFSFSSIVVRRSSNGGATSCSGVGGG